MIQIGMAPDPLRTACRPAEVLKRLIEARRMRRLEMPREPGDCHEVALAIMLNLREANAAHGWENCAGITEKIGLHSWLECDGWAVDTARQRLSTLSGCEKLHSRF
jgi:hypothetical protein